MLTATPVENRLEELYNLITILKPGQLKTPQEFRRRFVVRGDPRAPKNRGLLRELLADVMIRHSRGRVSVKLPPRRAHTIRLTPTPEEQALYQDVSHFVRRAMIGGKGARKLTLGILQREIGSSPMAVVKTLRKLVEQKAWRAERSELLQLAENAEAMTNWAKAEALQKLIRSAGQDKLIIFTHFQATLNALAEQLTAMGVDFVAYHGGLTIKQKEEEIRHLEKGGQVLLSTEADTILQPLTDAPIRWQPTGGQPLEAPLDQHTLEALLKRAETAVLRELSEHLTDLQQRVDRFRELDEARLVDYYDELERDLQLRSKRSVGERRDNLVDKLKAVQSERSHKLADINERYQVRLNLTLINLMIIQQSKLILPVNIQNRTTKLKAYAVWDPLHHCLELLACDVCGLPGQRSYLCHNCHTLLGTGSK